MNHLAPIYGFTDAVDYLNFEFESKRLKNNKFSLRAWSRQLGYTNPSFVSHILKKERALKIDVAERFTANLKLSADCKKYFEILVLLRNSKTVDEKKIYLDLLESLRPRTTKDPQSLSVEAFRVISDWYHTAILEMVELSDFERDFEWIKGRLGNELSLQQISKAIQRLLNLGLLVERPSGRLSRAKENPVILERNIPTEAIRYFHKQMIDKAKAAIEDQPIHERDIRGTMVSLRAEDYAKVQAIIKKAHLEIVKYSCKGNGDEVYQFNTQLFRITKQKVKV